MIEYLINRLPIAVYLRLLIIIAFFQSSIVNFPIFYTIQIIISEPVMDSENIGFASQIIKSSYAELGFNSIQKRIKIMKQLLTQRQLPDEGLDELTISYIMDQLAIMDSNNFHEKIGVGERQSRIFCPLVARRNFYMGHGIGRSGDVMANQPKAAGSSLLLQLAKFLTVSAFKQLNYQFVKDVLLLPMATGMALTMIFLTLAQKKPEKKYVLWSRIDQKTCLKSIVTANLMPVVIQEVIRDDSICCNHEQIEHKIKQLGPDKVLCIVSTTSCFAPRIPDDVSINSVIAKKYGVFHVVNNAYGVWCSKIAHQIKEGIQNGECTAVVQSMDKNFMVPVGGSIIFTQKEQTLKSISGKYPGRASSSPIVDLFLTLLSMGKNSISQLKKSRKENFKYMHQRGEKFAYSRGFRLLKTDQNSISIAMQLKSMQMNGVTQLGAILYSKRVMGHRILTQSDNKTSLCGHMFSNYGTHHEKYPFLPYITFACAVGTEKQQIDTFFQRLEQSIKELGKKQKKKEKMSKGIKEEESSNISEKSKSKQQAQLIKVQLKAQNIEKQEKISEFAKQVESLDNNEKQEKQENEQKLNQKQLIDSS